MKSLLIVLGNQLFDKSNHPQEISDIFMCEDFDLCTYEKHHKKKISFFHEKGKTWYFRFPIL